MAVSERHGGLLAVLTKPPSYLEELLQTKEDILLVHHKKKIDNVEEPTLSGMETFNVSNNSTLNLTGAPLEVDLNVMPMAYNYQLGESNNLEECHHVPMKLQLARKYTRNRNMTDYKLKSKATAIYCVCDATDAKQTVVLGSQHCNGDAIRILVFVKDCVGENYPENNMDNFINEHLLNVGISMTRIETEVTCLHELYGCKLDNNYPLEKLEHVGSILVGSSWNSHEYNIPQHGASIKMMLQVVVGHKNSVLHNFFQDFVFLHGCLETLQNKQSNLGEAIIQHNSSDVSVISQNLSSLLQQVHIIKRPAVTLNSLLDIIDNLSEMSFIDKLWNVLVGCASASDLRICLSGLFETISNTALSVQVFDDDKNTIIGKMINDIYSGKMIVPYLSSKQSLELLVQLGIQKLKSNYVAIIKHYDYIVAEQILEIWSKKGTGLMESKRGTFAELNLIESSDQLQFLLRVHVMLEFLQLVEQNCFTKDVILSVMKHAFNKYVLEKEELVESFFPLEKEQLCNLDVPLSYLDIKFMLNCSPHKWQIKMTSTQRNSSVTTLFHYSKKPIFPEIIYKYDVADTSCDELNKKLFVTKLERYCDTIDRKSKNS